MSNVPTQPKSNLTYRAQQRISAMANEFFMWNPANQLPKVIENRTAWRIVIRAKGSADLSRIGESDLVLAPFGSRTIAAALLAETDYERWTRRNYVRVTDIEPPKAPPPFGVFVRVMAWLAMILALFTMSALWTELPYWVALGGSFMAVLFVERKPIFQWVREGFNLVNIFVIATALTVSIYLLLTDGVPGSIASRAGVLVIFFIVIAASLPAVLYYIFERQKSTTLREFFLRDVIRLNPHIHTLDEAEFRYGKLADEVYGRQASQEFLGGLQVSLLINLVLSTIGWSLVLLPNILKVPPSAAPDEAIRILILPQPHPVIYGILGAYFFALSMLFRRYVRADLGPKAYTHVAVRQLLTVILVWVVSVPTALWNSLPAGGEAVLLVFSFVIGIVPDTALALIQDYLRNQTLLTNVVPSLREDQPLSDLEGVTLYDQARFLEEGIENVPSLAHHNLLDLMLRTRLPTARLVDLVDQAILYLHFFEDSDDSKPNASGSTGTALERLRHFGVRTASDLERACDMAQARGQDDLANLLAILDQPGDKVHRVQVALDAFADDEWMDFIREWSRNQDTVQARELDDIDKLVSHPEAYQGVGTQYAYEQSVTPPADTVENLPAN